MSTRIELTGAAANVPGALNYDSSSYPEYGEILRRIRRAVILRHLISALLVLFGVAVTFRLEEAVGFGSILAAIMILSFILPVVGFTFLTGVYYVKTVTPIRATADTLTFLGKVIPIENVACVIDTNQSGMISVHLVHDSLEQMILPRWYLPHIDKFLLVLRNLGIDVRVI